jgi:hypothetical protein
LGPIFDSSAALRNHLVAENEYLKTSILSASLGGMGTSSDDDGIDDPGSVGVRKVVLGGEDEDGDRDDSSSDTDSSSSNSYSSNSNSDGDDSDGDGDSNDDDDITDNDSSINKGSDRTINSNSDNDDDDYEDSDGNVFDEKETVKKLIRKNEFKTVSDSPKRGEKEHVGKVLKTRHGIKIEKELLYDPRSLVNLNGGEGESEENMEEDIEEDTEEDIEDSIENDMGESVEEDAEQDSSEEGGEEGSEDNEYKAMIDFDASDEPDVDAYLTDYRSKVDDVLKDLLSDLQDEDTDTHTDSDSDSNGNTKSISKSKSNFNSGSYQNRNNNNKKNNNNKNNNINNQINKVTKDISKNTDKKKSKSKLKSVTSNTKKKSVVNEGKSSDNSHTLREFKTKNNDNYSLLENNISSISEFAKNALKYKSMLLCFIVAVLMHYSIVSGILK